MCPRTRFLTLAVVLVAGAWLVWFAHSTRWVMDADEAVHAVEALRLHEDLEDGAPGRFLHDTYFPEVWHPGVDPHVRWYPFVHAWALQPSFALLGPSDFSARLPSVVFLAGSCLVFWELARRLARARGEVSGLLAVLLLLTAPNLLTFSVQSLTALCSVFTCFLALLAYLWSLEREHPPGRSLAAGALLAGAMLTKYDHGGVLALSLGLSELSRAGFRPLRLLRSGAGRLVLTAALPVALWFAHPAKLAALADSAAHPFYGSPRVILRDFVLTWSTEYASTVLVGTLAALAFLDFARRLREPGPRAVWVWAAFSLVFYALRGRYHFRYNIVEAPIFLLMLATALPGWLRSSCDRLAQGRALAAAAGAAFLALGAWSVASPGAIFRSLQVPFTWFHGLRADAWGMSHEPSFYLDRYVEGAADLARHWGASALGLGLAGLCLAALAGRARGQAGRERLAWSALALAVLPGTLVLWTRLPRMIESELEGHPDLGLVHAFAREHAPPGASVLLGGGWDQLSNNALRWYRATQDGVRLEQVPVCGDMIGSQVFPPGPRIAYWAERLALADTEELPERILLLEPGPAFLYRARFGPEAGLYARIAQHRGAYEQRASRSFPGLGLRARMLARVPGHGPVDAAGFLGARDLEDRRWVGHGGWSMGDCAIRHFASWRMPPRASGPELDGIAQRASGSRQPPP